MQAPVQTSDEMLAEIGKLNPSQRKIMRRSIPAMYPGLHTVSVRQIGWKHEVEVVGGGVRQTYQIGPRGKVLDRQVREVP